MTVYYTILSVKVERRKQNVWVAENAMDSVEVGRCANSFQAINIPQMGSDSEGGSFKRKSQNWERYRLWIRCFDERRKMRWRATRRWWLMGIAKTYEEWCQAVSSTLLFTVTPLFLHRLLYHLLQFASNIIVNLYSPFYEKSVCLLRYYWWQPRGSTTIAATTLDSSVYLSSTKFLPHVYCGIGSTTGVGILIFTATAWAFRHE